MLQLEHISFSVPDGREILHDVNLTLDERMTVITGPNGSGKSTLAKIIMGINTPSSGRILLNGEDITACSVTERAKRGISFALQQPVRFKGITAVHGARKYPDACAGVLLSFRGWHVRRGIREPRDRRFSFGR